MKKNRYLYVIFAILILSVSAFLKINSNIIKYRLDINKESQNVTNYMLNDGNLQSTKYRFVNSVKNIIPIRQVKTFIRLSFIESLTLKKKNELTENERTLLKEYKEALIVETMLPDYKKPTFFLAGLFGFLIPLVFLYYVYTKFIKQSIHHYFILITFYVLNIITFIFYRLNENIIENIKQGFNI